MDIKKTIDYHVHIGQYFDTYFDAYDVFSAIEKSIPKTGITEIRYSSTSSCRYDVELSKIEEEIAYAQSYKSKHLITKPYFWMVPKYITDGINLEQALKTFDYCGFKIHPLAQQWDLTEKKHIETLESIFEISSYNLKYSILIHTGKEDCANPSRFLFLFDKYPDAKVILAHSKPLNSVMYILNKYKNVYSDIAFIEKQYIKTLMNTDIKSKILFGTDFPITAYYKCKFSGKLLNKQYVKDCKSLCYF